MVHDSTAWSGGGVERPTPQHLDAVQSAVIAGRQIILDYVARAGVPTTRTVHPLGLATKGGSWYLVAETDAGRRTFRVDRIQSVEITDDPVVRPEGFVLADAWQMITTEVELVRTPIVVRALGGSAVDVVVAAQLRHSLADRHGESPTVASRSRSAATTSTRLPANWPATDEASRCSNRSRFVIAWRPSRAELGALYAGTAASANSAIDVNRHVGDTSPDGVAVAPVPPLS